MLNRAFFLRGVVFIAIFAMKGLCAQDRPPSVAVSSANVASAASLAEYRRSVAVNGKIRSVGSSALNQFLNRWAEAFKRIHPDVDVEVTGGGSGTAPPALTEGVAELAPMSRVMNAAERAAFRAKFGYEPTEITAGIDALAIFVNKNNPLTQISLRDLDAIYSLTRSRGGSEKKTWGELGASGEWAQRQIRVYGPQPTQGMHGVFRADVLNGGEYRYDMRTDPVASGIVQSVGADDNAIGFASHSIASARTKSLALKQDNSGASVTLSQQSVTSGAYPLARKLFIYVNRTPGVALDPAVAELMRFICSAQGQAISVELNAFPLSAPIAEAECLQKIR